MLRYDRFLDVPGFHEIPGPLQIGFPYSQTGELGASKLGTGGMGMTADSGFDII